MGVYSEPQPHDQRYSQGGSPQYFKDFGDMIKAHGQSSPTSDNHGSSVGSTPPSTPLTPGTPQPPPLPHQPSSFCPPTTPTTPVGQGFTPYRQRPPSFTESDSRDSQSSALSDTDSQSDAASVCSSNAAEWANIDISPLIKEELKQAIVARRKTRGLPDVQVDFTPREPGKLTPEEEERRRLQKERNRSAAAKCRTKKRSAVSRLVQEAEELETVNLQLREEMKSLELEREKLKFLLNMHSPKCLMESSSEATPLPSTSLPKQPRMSPSRVQSPTSEAGSPQYGVMTPMSLSRATTPMLDRSPGCAPAGPFMPLTPSTTHSRSSSTEPSTPAMLTPTSVKDAPVFPTTASMTMVLNTGDTHSAAASSSAASASDVLAANLTGPGMSETPNEVYPFTAGLTELSGGQSPGCTMFPPIVPPTPEVEDDDSLSASFVKQYLGDDAFLEPDLPLPTSEDNITLVGHPAGDQAFSHTSVHAPNLAVAETTRVTGLQGVTTGALPGFISTFLPGQADSRIGDSPLPCQQMPLHEASDHDKHALSALETPDPISTPDSPLTLSFSALMGLSFDEMDRAMEAAAASSK